MRFWTSVTAIFIAGALTGGAFVIAPSASTLLLDPNYKDLGSVYYGFISLFICLGAVLASIWGGRASSRIGLKWVVILGLLTHAVSMLLFSSTILVNEMKWLDLTLFSVSLFLSGAAFGATLTASNVILFHLFPKNYAAVISAFYAAVGIGTTLSPVIFHHLVSYDNWWADPFAFACFFLITAFFLYYSLDNIKTKERIKTKFKNMTPLLYLISYMIIYGLIFSLFVSWGMTYLTEWRDIPPKAASISLGLFWAGITIGRLITTALSLKVRARIIYLTLPPLMVFAFLTVFGIHDDISAYISFGLVGLSCSSGFPLTFKFGEELYIEQAARVSGLLMASYMIGYGVGTYLEGLATYFVSLDVLFNMSFLLPVALIFITIPPMRSYGKIH